MKWGRMKAAGAETRSRMQWGRTLRVAVVVVVVVVVAVIVLITALILSEHRCWGQNMQKKAWHKLPAGV